MEEALAWIIFVSNFFFTRTLAKKIVWAQCFMSLQHFYSLWSSTGCKTVEKIFIFLSTGAVQILGAKTGWSCKKLKRKSKERTNGIIGSHKQMALERLSSQILDLESSVPAQLCWYWLRVLILLLKPWWCTQMTKSLLLELIQGLHSGRPFSSDYHTPPGIFLACLWS